MVRFAGLRGQVAAGVTTASPEGLTPAQQLAAITQRIRELIRDQRNCWVKLVGELRSAGIAVIDADELTAGERDWLERKFTNEIFPILTPIAVGPTHPFPFIQNRGLALALQLYDREADRELEALVTMPAQLERFVRLPGPEIRFIAIECVVLLFMEL